MNIENFLNQPRYVEIIKEAEGLKGKIFSDVIDDEGNQYVDLVQGGGGALGIALVSYTAVLEAAGLRFFHLAGTSSGAINTLILAGIDNIDKKKSNKVLEVLSQQDLFEFVDGDPSLKEIFQKLMKGIPFKNVLGKILWNYRKIHHSLSKNLGLNPGIELENWIEKVLFDSPNKITSIEQLCKKRGSDYFPKGIRNRISGNPIKDKEARLCIIAADITTQTKVQFPKMAHLYWGEDVKNTSPAKMVRASVSVPFFFTPFEIKKIPNAGETANEEWVKFANYYGPVPEKVKFVDGGLISNFPINVFHSKQNDQPNKPTFGVKLSSYREIFSDVDDFGAYLGSMFNTMRHDSDNEFLLENPDFKKLICLINANKDFNWLNFKMSDEKKKKLFLLGAEKGLEFIKNFNWEEYKVLRRNAI